MKLPTGEDPLMGEAPHVFAVKALKVEATTVAGQETLGEYTL